MSTKYQILGGPCDGSYELEDKEEPFGNLADAAEYMKLFLRGLKDMPVGHGTQTIGPENMAAAASGNLSGQKLNDVHSYEYRVTKREQVDGVLLITARGHVRNPLSQEGDPPEQ